MKGVEGEGIRQRVVKKGNVVQKDNVRMEAVNKHLTNYQVTS